MTKSDIEHIRDVSTRKGYRTDYAIADALGISRASLSRKFNGKSDFTLGEIRAMNATLGLPVGDIAKIFLANRD